jgi:hypothetical protein
LETRPVACLALLALVGTGCDALLGIPAEERLEAGDAEAGAVDAAMHPTVDSTLPGIDGGDDGPPFGDDAAQDATVDAGGGDDAAPDCPTAFNANWAAWPMPNSAQDIEAGSPNPEGYTDHGDGTVTDKVTGLMWQQSPQAGTFTWSAAKDACAQLGFAAHNDWHLPSYIELVSIVEYGPSSPTVNPAAFPGTPADTFWSSTPFNADPYVTSPSAYFVEFGGGSTFYDYVSNTHYARCVRASGADAPSCPSVLIPGDGTVFDTKTKLTWAQDEGPAGPVDWSTAKTYCATLKLAGLAAWRLPTIKELLTLVDASVNATYSFAIDPSAFPFTAVDSFWSSTLVPGAPPSAWGLRADGSNYPLDTAFNSSMGARCVR